MFQGDTEGPFFLISLASPSPWHLQPHLYTRISPLHTPPSLPILLLLLLYPHFSPPHHLQTLRSYAPPLTSLSSPSRPPPYHLSAPPPLNTSLPLSLLSFPSGSVAGAPPLPSTSATPRLPIPASLSVSHTSFSPHPSATPPIRLFLTIYSSTPCPVPSLNPPFLASLTPSLPPPSPPTSTFRI